ncbi:MAG: LytTR family DNA-binding domain-containing protein [Ferruginibacter sp.]
MIEAIHIEDEPRNLQLLENLVRTYCGDLVTLVGNARNIKDAITLIKAKKPQLIFLDIELSQGNAFDMLAELKEISFEIIFITAFNEYAVKAFRHNAVDYLLKPINIEELKQATSKAVQRIGLASSGNENVLKAIKEISDFGSHKIGLPVSDGVLFINCDQIIRISAKGSFSILHLVGDKKVTCTKNLKVLEQLLPEAFFLRVHHSWIVNLKYLKKYFRGKNGYMEMEDGSIVMVSVRKKGNFLNHLLE